ncbi:hypothetical protein, partial [Armatimonas sp.]|uniref:hypothetical protein n=1 Tax=Armatimonas sp. TaxID=1872638 RepID=UPI00374FF942
MLPTFALVQESPDWPTLATLFPQVRWTPERHGVLLAVAPEKHLISLDSWQANSDDQGNLRAPREGWRPESLATYTEGRLRRFGSVTVLAPQTMNTWKPLLPPKDTTGAVIPGMSALLASEAPVLALLATCDPEQWRRATSKQGLRRSDLRRPQYALFEALVPKPLAYSVQEPGNPLPGKEMPLTAEQQQGVGIRVKLLGNVRGKLLEGGRSFPIVFHRRADSSTDVAPTIHAQEASDSNQSLEEFFRENNSHSVTAEVPNRLKSLPPELSRLTAPVSLEGSALTVATLVARIAQATGKPLRVDKRLGEHAVFVRGRRAAAGELLQSLCFGATASVRDLAGNYILAPDSVPLQAGRAHLEDAHLLRRLQDSSSEAELNRRIAALQPTELLEFDDNDPAALPPALRQKAVQAQQRNLSEQGVEVSLSELPLVLQGVVVKAIDELARLSETPEYQKEKLDLRMDNQRVMVSCSPWWSLVIPGVGEANENPLTPLHNWTPEPTLEPLALAGHALFVRLSRTEDVEPVVQAARATGATALWVEGSPAILEAAARPRLLPIFGVVSVLRGSEGKTDRNARGETSVQYALRRGVKEPGLPWLDLGDVGNVQGARQRVTEAAQVPGLAGLVLRDVLPPGYGQASDPERGRYVYGALGELGYSLANRQAFLREQGCDPSDIHLEPLSLMGEELTPLVPYSEELAETWRQWRVKRGAAFAQGIRQVVSVAAPTLPVFLERAHLWQEQGWHYQLTPWFVEWRAGKHLPDA